MFALVIAVGALALAVFVSAILDPRPSGDDEQMRDELSL
jgi:hypothetical protein